MKPRKNYLNNRDMLIEIHRSKNTFCSYVDTIYQNYDIILDDISKINVETVTEAKQNHAKQLTQEKYESKKMAGERVRLVDCEINYDSIPKQDLVFRIMTYDHIPDDPGRKKNPKTEADRKVKLNFPPFQHWRFDDEGNLVCVGKSHWIGGMENGYFSIDHGRATNKLALMWMKLVNKYATKGNVRDYSYNDEMRGQAIAHLSQIGLKFDESKSNNPFSYYTSATKNSFVKVINAEKRNQTIRDEILEMHDLSPSYSRMHDVEWNASVERFTQSKLK